MGTYWTVYFGPVLLCKNRHVDVTISQMKCLECNLEIDAKFCSKCGSEVQLVDTIKQQKAVKNWEVSEAIKERLQEVGTWLNSEDKLSDIWISNMASNFNIDDDEFNVSVNSLKVRESLEKFLQEYGEECVTLREAYGKENVELDFRLLRWGS